MPLQGAAIRAVCAVEPASLKVPLLEGRVRFAAGLPLPLLARALWSWPAAAGCALELACWCCCRVSLQCAASGLQVVLLVRAGYYCQRAVCILGTWVLLQGTAVRVQCEAARCLWQCRHWALMEITFMP